MHWHTAVSARASRTMAAHPEASESRRSAPRSASSARPGRESRAPSMPMSARLRASRLRRHCRCADPAPRPHSPARTPPFRVRREVRARAWPFRVPGTQRARLAVPPLLPVARRPWCCKATTVDVCTQMDVGAGTKPPGGCAWRVVDLARSFIAHAVHAVAIAMSRSPGTVPAACCGCGWS